MVFDPLGGLGQPPMTDPAAANPIAQALANATNTQQMLAQNANPPDAGVEWSARVEKDPETGQQRTMYDLTLPEEILKSHLQSQQFMGQLIGAYHNEFTRLQNASSGNPILDVLSTIGGNMAMADPRLPPVVRALGMSARELNPTPQELADRKIGLLTALNRASEQGTQGDIAIANMLREERALNEKTLHDRQLEQESVAREKETEWQHRIVDSDRRVQRLASSLDKYALKGQDVGLEGVTAAAKTMGITDPAEIQAAADAHSAKAAAAQQGIKQAQAFDMEKIHARAQEQRASAIAAFGQRSVLMDKQADIKKGIADYTNNLKQMDAFKTVPPKDLTDLGRLRGSESYLDGLEKALKDPSNANITGLYAALNQPLPTWAKSTERAVLENELIHETPRILNLIGSGQGGGFSIMRSPKGVQLMQDLGVSKLDRLDQALGKLGNVRSSLRDVRLGMVSARPGALWRMAPDVLGRDKDLVDQIRTKSGLPPVMPSERDWLAGAAEAAGAAPSGRPNDPLGIR